MKIPKKSAPKPKTKVVNRASKAAKWMLVETTPPPSDSDDDGIPLGERASKLMGASIRVHEIKT